MLQSGQLKEKVTEMDGNCMSVIFAANDIMIAALYSATKQSCCSYRELKGDNCDIVCHKNSKFQFQQLSFYGSAMLQLKAVFTSLHTP